MGVFAYGNEDTDATECRSLNVPFSGCVCYSTLLEPISDCFSSEVNLKANTDPIAGATSLSVSIQNLETTLTVSEQGFTAGDYTGGPKVPFYKHYKISTPYPL